MSELVKGKDVIGLNIVTIDTGSVIDTVKDIGYNPNTHTVEALFVRKKRLFSAAKAIHMRDVINVGKDAIVVHDAAVIKSVKEQTEAVKQLSDSSKFLVKTNVLTAQGTELGKVTDIYFDSKTGVVENMEVSQGGFKTLTEGKKSIRPVDIVTIGADATIVSTYTELLLDQQGEEHGLKGSINDAKAKANELADNVQSATDDLNKRAKKKGKAIAADMKQRANEFDEGVSNVEDKVSDQVNTNYNRGRKVIRESTKKFQDQAKVVEIETKKVIKKK